MSTKQDITMKLMAYADGELSAADRAEVEQLLAQDPSLGAELAELHSISLFAQDGFEAPLANVKVDVFDGVMARIAAEDAAAQPSAWTRLTKWLGEVFRLEHPMALAGLAAAVIAIVVGALMSSGSSSSVNAPVQDMAQVQPGPRRGMEAEHKPGGRNTAFVETWEVAKGKVVVDVNKDDPDQPMVLWHVIDGEGTSTPKGL